jgi:hypothetical protein
MAATISDGEVPFPSPFPSIERTWMMFAVRPLPRYSSARVNARLSCADFAAAYSADLAEGRSVTGCETRMSRPHFLAARCGEKCFNKWNVVQTCWSSMNWRSCASDSGIVLPPVQPPTRWIRACGLPNLAATSPAATRTASPWRKSIGRANKRACGSPRLAARESSLP